MRPRRLAGIEGFDAWRRGEDEDAIRRLLAYYDSFWWDPIAARRAAVIRQRLESAEPTTDRG